MAAKKVHLQIITPTKIKVDEDADMVIMRCASGDMGIMPGREPCTSVLDYGVLRILDGEVERRIAVYGGLAEMKNNKLTILTPSAEWPEDIDRARAEAEREQAEHLMLEKADDIGIQHARLRMRRSLVQIEVSSYPLMAKPDHNI